MIEMTVTEFARKLRTVFDRIEHAGEEVVLIRNKHRIARILPGSPHLAGNHRRADLWYPDARSERVRQKRIAALDRLKKKPLLTIDDTTGDILGRLAAWLAQKGRRHKHRVQDLWLASQAIQYSYRLLTTNTKDFAGIPGLNLVVYGK